MLPCLSWSMMFLLQLIRVLYWILITSFMVCLIIHDLSDYLYDISTSHYRDLSNKTLDSNTALA